MHRVPLSETKVTISILRRDREFQYLVLQLKADAMAVCREMISSAVLDAAHTLFNLVREGRSEEVRRRAALDVLGLAGLRNPGGALIRSSFEEGELRRAQDLELEEQQRWVVAELTYYRRNPDRFEIDHAGSVAIA